MIRILFFIALLALVLFLVVFISQVPGTVQIVIGETNAEGGALELHSRLGPLVLIVFLLGVVLAMGWHLVSLTMGSVRGFSLWRRNRRLRLGYESLTRGMVAVAAGDPQDAQRQAGRARSLLGTHPLALLLSAEAAQLANDLDAAKLHFGAMMKRTETEFIGIRGLLIQALDREDAEEALELARRAVALRPRTGWVLKTLFDLQVRARLWSEAQDTLHRAGRERVFAEHELKRRRALLAFLRAEEAQRSGRKEEARDLYREAQSLEPRLVPAVVAHADCLIDLNSARSAAKLLEKAWSAEPHADIASAYLRARAGAPGLLNRRTKESATAILRWAERLHALQPESLEGQLVLATAAVEAEDWARAREVLAQARQTAGETPPARLCRLMARLETGERGDVAAARDWLERAAEAGPPPVWVCGNCGALSESWTAVCPSCGSLDSLRQEIPPSLGPVLTILPPAEMEITPPETESDSETEADQEANANPTIIEGAISKP